jgi:outer membrane protein insertion porin family
VNGNTERAGRLVSVRVEGAVRTRPGFLEDLFQPYLQPSSTQGIYPFSAFNHNYAPAMPQNFGGILLASRHLTSQLMRTDLFSSVQPRLEASRDVFAREGDVDLVLRAREKGWFYAKTSTEVGNGEGTAGMTLRARNVFGGAETLEGNVSAGTKTRRSFQGSLAAPLLYLDPTLRTFGTLAISGVRRDNSSFASSSEDAHMLRASIRVRSVGPHGTRGMGKHVLT